MSARTATNSVQERNTFADGGVDGDGVVRTQAPNAPFDVVAAQPAFHAVRRGLEQRGVARQLRPAMPRVEALDRFARELPLLAFEIQYRSAASSTKASPLS